MKTRDRLTVVLYLLLRDYITFGELETILAYTSKPDIAEWMDNDIAAEYASRIAEELKT